MIIFVGIHYKQGKQALDSSTLSGKKIDQVINALKAPCLKCNLFSTNYIPPHGDEYSSEIAKFITTVPAEKGDIVVLLGRDVQKHFPGSYFRKAKIIKYRHPSFSPKSFSEDLAKLICRSK